MHVVGNEARPRRPSHVYRAFMERLPIRYSDVLRVGGAIGPLKFNAAQERLWRLISQALDANEPLRLIVLKARREGVSTLTEALMTTLCTFIPYTNALVMAQQGSSANRIWGMSKRFVLDSPLRAYAKMVGNTIQFKNHAQIELNTAGSPESTRSADITILHNSELAFWKKHEAMLAARQCLPTGEETFSLELDESTANGMDGDGALFYEQWLAACDGSSGFTPVFLPWHTFPDYTSRNATPLEDVDEEEQVLLRDLHLTWGQLRWRRMTLATKCEGSIDKWNQEYPATPEMAFIVSGIPFFRPSELLWVEPYIHPGRRGKLEIVHGRITFQPEQGGRLTVFQAPERGHQYIIGADPSMGLSGDHSRSAAEILDMATLEQVAEYEGETAPHAFAKDLALMGRVYNMALLAPEVQASSGGGGKEILVFLQQDWHYYHIHHWYRPDSITRRPAVVYGWETNSNSRPRMVARIREAVQERSAIVHSRRLVNQLRAFGENDSNKLEALSGHDDMLFAWGIALMSRSENYVARRLGMTVRQEDHVDLQRLGYTLQRDPVMEEAMRLEGLFAGQGSGVHQPASWMAW